MYNIEMVYKTRKNKRQKNSKRQSYKQNGFTKRPLLYGGNLDIKPPTALSNLKKGASIGMQIADNLVANGLNYAQSGFKNIAKSAGIDPSLTVKQQIEEMGETVGELKQVLSTPEGQRALSNLGSVASEVVEKVVAPGIQKAADSVVEHSGPIMNKATNAAMDAFSATPAGFLLDVPKFFGDVAGIVENSTSMVADVLDVTKDTIDKTKESKKDVETALFQVKSLLDNANRGMSSGLSGIQNSVDNYGKSIMEQGKMKVDNKMMQSAELTSNLLRNEAKMVGGRVANSYLEFTKPITKKMRSQKYNRLQSRKYR